MNKHSIAPEDVFLKDIKELIRNLLIDNPNYNNGHYFQDLQRMATHDLIRDTKERAKHILERIDAIEHLVKDFHDNPESVLDLSNEDKKSLSVSVVNKNDLEFKERHTSLEFNRDKNGEVEVWIYNNEQNVFYLSKNQSNILTAWLNISSR